MLGYLSGCMCNWAVLHVYRDLHYDGHPWIQTYFNILCSCKLNERSTCHVKANPFYDPSLTAWMWPCQVDCWCLGGRSERLGSHAGIPRRDQQWVQLPKVLMARLIMHVWVMQMGIIGTNDELSISSLNLFPKLSPWMCMCMHEIKSN